MQNRRLFTAIIAAFAALVLLPGSASALKFEPGLGGTAAQVGSVSDVATGDFNGDGEADLAVASGPAPGGFTTQGINILISQGDGSFQKTVTLDPGGQGYFSVYTGDFNGDGDLDLYSYQYNPFGRKVFLGDGLGTFGAGINQGSAISPGARNSIAVGDLNGDASMDIVTGGFTSGEFQVGIADGSGGFTFTSGSIPAAAGKSLSTAIGDFNGDGDNDAALGDNGGHINVLLGNGSGSLTPSADNPATVAAGSRNFVTSLAVADFNGDGIDDVGASAANAELGPVGSVQTFLGDAADTLTTNPAPSGAVFSPDEYSPGVDPGPYDYSDVVAADFDGDGDRDLAYNLAFRPNGPSEYKAGIRLSNGDGTFTTAPGSPFTYDQGSSPWGLAQGDLNGDGAPDLVAAAPGGGGCFGCGAPVLMNSPEITPDPSSLDFGSVKINTESDPETVDITNTGGPTVTIASVTISGTNADQFSIDSTSGCVLGGTDSCPKNITFQPTTTGAKSATLTIHIPGGEDLAMPLSGTGVVPQATFNPNPLEFGEVPVGITSTTGTVTVSSTGSAPLEIGEVAKSAGDSGSFDIVSGSDTCSNTTLQIEGSCEFKVTMTPVLAFGLGYKALSISVPSNDPDSGDQQTTVTGTATNPGISLTPATYDFGEATINDGMVDHQFTVTSNGSTPLTVQDVSLTGPDAADYELGNITGCTNTPVPATQTCTFMVVFDPEYNDHATRTATLVVDSNAASSPSQSTLSGTAVYPDATVDPDPAEFGEVRINQTSPVKTLTVTSNGTTAADFSDAAVFGPDAADFDIASNTCDGQTVAIGATCQYGITMKPGTTGDKEAVLVFDTQSSDVVVELFGTGIDPAGTLTPASHDFGGVTIGTTGPAAPFTIKSTGSDPISVTSATITGTDAGSFKLGDSAACNGTKNPGATCDLSITFAPEFGSSTNRSAQLTVVTDIGEFKSSLTGTAVAVPVPPTTKATVKLKAAKKVKRGKKLKVTATVKNTGTATITGLTLKTAVTKKLAKAPKVVKISSLAPGASIKRTIKVAVKKKAKAGKKLKVTVTASSGGKKLHSAKRSIKIKK